MELLKMILIAIGIIIVVFNILAASLTLGYRLEEKYPNRKSVFEIFDSFWTKIWSKLIK